ncbi:MAG: YceI family protein [Dokdonia sp.]|jgi:polyisoprenoid-binding protein YceI|nr:hypothetical protein [Cytophagaceae bacterium]
MKPILILLGLLFCAQGVAQKYYTKTGKIDFEASVAAFEPVKASHQAVTAILDTDTGDLAILALVKGFRFRNALMEEHFNENYAESDQYPKATFKGNLANFSTDDLGEVKTYTANGTLNFHGQSQEITTKVKLRPEGSTHVLETAFSVAPETFGIEIPSVVSEKISKQINIDVVLTLIKK